ncbi:hypothetical protein SRABI76_03240 [Microbacterium oxydans]|uniref:hypothetical protein n=1 Tax=Microbacterium oxydans TaxID=82380 RepID=UPI001D996A9B|nr:hypothetical protein [Microbacterium oxydans]CAH0250890.1 hypothetical protein SRABI76_03240 [Microbacterium oxydans]
MHRKQAAIRRPPAGDGQRRRAAPDGDGTLVAQELIRSQPGAVLVRADAALELLSCEGIELVVIGGRADPRPHAAERRLEVASAEATGIRSGIQCLSYRE